MQYNFPLCKLNYSTYKLQFSMLNLANMIAFQLKLQILHTDTFIYLQVIYLQVPVQVYRQCFVKFFLAKMLHALCEISSLT